MQKSILLLVFCGVFGQVFAQDLCFVAFRDKGAEPTFCAASYFHPAALERRAKHGLESYDFYDLPVCEDYVGAVSELADSLRYRLRWLNGVTVLANAEQVAAIKALPFVSGVEVWSRGGVVPGSVFEVQSGEGKVLSSVSGFENEGEWKVLRSVSEVQEGQGKVLRSVSEFGNEGEWGDSASALCAVAESNSSGDVAGYPGLRGVVDSNAFGAFAGYPGLRGVVDSNAFGAFAGYPGLRVVVDSNAFGAFAGYPGLRVVVDSNAFGAFAGYPGFRGIADSTGPGAVAHSPALRAVADSAGPNRQLRELHDLIEDQLGLGALREAGLSGKGVRIAILDAGFKFADLHPDFAHLFEGKQIVASRDFYKPKRSTVFRHSKHGMVVLYCIAGRFFGQPFGAAPEAEFLLARTEHLLFEKFKEEDHWFAAMEWADQNGADIINSSLGYSKGRYAYEEMDGLSKRVTQAARIAVRKGILVVNSVGNEGNEKYKYLSAPSDADSVIAVGATFPMQRHAMPFTSYGPNARGVVKPDVAAPGYVMAPNNKSGYNYFAGTSFSAPLVSGWAACLMERFPNASNMEIAALLRKTGHLYPYFDYLSGYGVPVPDRALSDTAAIGKRTFQVFQRNDSLIFVIDTTQILWRDAGERANGKIFYVHVEGADGKLAWFRQWRFYPDINAFAVRPEIRDQGRLVRAWFEGYLWEERRRK